MCYGSLVASSLNVSHVSIRNRRDGALQGRSYETRQTKRDTVASSNMGTPARVPRESTACKSTVSHSYTLEAAIGPGDLLSMKAADFCRLVPCIGLCSYIVAEHIPKQ